MPAEIIGPGKFVTLTYSITDGKGTVMEQSDLPVSYIHGGDTELIGGMDRAVAGKCAGDKVQMTIGPQDAFGSHDPALTFTDAIENIPEPFRRLGAEVQMQSESGEVKTFIVTRIEDGRLTVDGNHPLAGKTLEVTVKIVSVRDATKEDAMQIATGSPESPTLN